MSFPNIKYEPRPPYSPLDEVSQSHDPKEETPLFERRKPRPAKEERPNSAKVDSKTGKAAKPRPVSASKRTPVLLANIGRQRVYGPPKEPKPRLKQIPWDKERLYEEHLALKVNNNTLRDENVKLRTRVNQLEKEVLKFGELMDAQSGDKFFPPTSHLVGGLKASVKDLKSELRQREDEITELKKNIKTTRTAELEVELQAYIDECTRLRHHLEEVLARQNELIHFESPFEKDSLRLQQGAAISNLQKENASAIIQLEQTQQELERWKERAKDLEKKAGKTKKSPDRQMKNELSKAKSDLERLEQQKTELIANFQNEQNRLRTEALGKEEKIRLLQVKVAEAEMSIATYQKQAQDQQLELKSMRGQLTDLQRDIVTQSRRSQGLQVPSEPRVSKPTRVFEKIHRYITQKNILLSVFLSLLDRQNKGVLDARELQAGLKRYGISARFEQVEEAVMTASGGKTTVSLIQLETQYEKLDFGTQYDSSSEEEPKPKSEPRPEARAKIEQKPEGKIEQKSEGNPQTKPDQNGERKPALKAEAKPKPVESFVEEAKLPKTGSIQPEEVKIPGSKPAVEERKQPLGKPETEEIKVQSSKPVVSEAVKHPKPVLEEAKQSKTTIPVPSTDLKSNFSNPAVSLPPEESKIPNKRPASPVPVRPSTPQELVKSALGPRAKTVAEAVEREKRGETESSELRERMEVQSLNVPHSPEAQKKPEGKSEKKTGAEKQKEEGKRSPPQESVPVPIRPGKKEEVADPGILIAKTESKPTPEPSKPSEKPLLPPPTDAIPAESVQFPASKIVPESSSASSIYTPIPLQDVSDLLRHISFRLQIHRIPKEKTGELLFGQGFDRHREVTLFELQELLSQQPINITDASQAELLSRFLLEPDKTNLEALQAFANGTNVSSKAKTVLAKLDKTVPSWTIFSTENEEEYDNEIAEALADHFTDLQLACEEADPEKNEFVSMEEFRRILGKVRIGFKETHMKYLELLFYSHNFELDRVPYYNFIKAYSGVKGEDEDEYSQEQFDEGGDDYEDDEDRAELVRAYLSEMAHALQETRRTVKEVFDASEDGRLYPPEFVFGARELGLPDLRKEDLMVVLESLQDEESDELCINLAYLEDILQHYGVPKHYPADVPEAESSEYFPPRMEYSEDSPEKREKKPSPQISEESPFIGYPLISEFGKSSPKRSLTREDFEALKDQRRDSSSGSEPPEALEEPSPQRQVDEDVESEENYEEEGFEDAGQESSIASNISY